jgi:1,4-alpha-glucan branching enzyme
MWLSDENEWVFRRLQGPQRRMSELAARHLSPNPLTRRALNQAGRELLLAQSSDWPFILRTGTSPGYARERVRTHLASFHELTEQVAKGEVREQELAAIEARNNLFADLNYRYWAEAGDTRSVPCPAGPC